MKKVIFTLTAIILLAGCTAKACPEIDNKPECQENPSCIAIHKPCNSSEEGCKDNVMFSECKTRKTATK